MKSPTSQTMKRANKKPKAKKINLSSEREGIRTPADKVHENAELIFGNQQVTNVFVT